MAREQYNTARAAALVPSGVFEEGEGGGGEVGVVGDDCGGHEIVAEEPLLPVGSEEAAGKTGWGGVDGVMEGKGVCGERLGVIRDL